MSAPKAAAPVVGFNHNVQYGPRMYHVQTEDSGLPHSHYITHIFVGGNIVASMKSSYANLVDTEPDLAKKTAAARQAGAPDCAMARAPVFVWARAVSIHTFP